MTLQTEQIEEPTTSAVFSADGLYRYSLTRRVGFGPRRVTFIMLNPSTADAERNDPTIRRCIDFANRWDYGWLYVANLSPLRATDPRVMIRAGDEPADIARRNVESIVSCVQRSAMVVAAWGNHGAESGRAAAVLAALDRLGVTPQCIGVTATGQPRHPLYVPGDTNPQPYIPNGEEIYHGDN